MGAPKSRVYYYMVESRYIAYLDMVLGEWPCVRFKEIHLLLEIKTYTTKSLQLPCKDHFLMGGSFECAAIM